MDAKEYITKGIIWAAGASLAINSWLVKEKVADISEDIKAVAVAVRALEVTTAVAQHEMSSLRALIAQNQSRTEKHSEQLQYVNEMLAKIVARLNMERIKP